MDKVETNGDCMRAGLTAPSAPEGDTLSKLRWNPDTLMGAPHVTGTTNPPAHGRAARLSGYCSMATRVALQVLPVGPTLGI